MLISFEKTYHRFSLLLRKRYGMGRASRCRKRRKKSSLAVKLGSHENFVSLCKWMSNNNWKPVANLCPAIFKLTGRGLMTLDNLQVNDLIVQIPTNLLLTKERVLQEWPALNAFALSTAEILTLFLLKCKKEDTNKHYTSLLPNEFSIAAMCINQEVATLPKYLQDKILQSKQYYTEKFRRLSVIWGKLSGGNLSPKDFHMAWCAVNTRAVFYKDTTSTSGSEESNMALAPYLDMLNHNSEARITAGYNFLTKCYEIRTLEPVKRYSEVFINYGPHDNVKLFIEYGFVVPKNPQAVVEFDISLFKELFPKQLGESALKEALLKELALNKKLFCSRDGLSWDAQVALTIVITPEAKLNNIATPYDLDVRSEEKLFKTFSETIVGQLLRKWSAIRERAEAIISPTAAFGVAKCLIDDMLDILTNVSNTL